jgi:hypothetical protein
MCKIQKKLFFLKKIKWEVSLKNAKSENNITQNNNSKSNEKKINKFYVQIKHISREWKRQTARKDIKIKLNLKTCGKMKIYAHSARRDEWKTERNTSLSVENWILKNAFLP